MFNIIPLILILVSLAAVIIIVTRKFSILANLDINTIQSEREAKFKEQIIGKRIKRNFLKYYSKVARVIKPLGTAGGNFLKWTFEKLVEFKDNYNKEEVVEDSGSDNLDRLFSEIDDLLREEKFEEAEKKYIEIIAVDLKNTKAFRGLGQLYSDRKDYNEAKQTFEHVLRLMEKSAAPGSEADMEENGEGDNAQLGGIYFDLAQVYIKQENSQKALSSLNKALSIEPNNPRFLDCKIEVSITKKDKAAAIDAYGKLVEVNPDNKKIEEFKEEIDKL